MWVPFAVIIGLLVVCCCFGFAAYLYRKKKSWALCARIAPKEENDAEAGGRFRSPLWEA